MIIALGPFMPLFFTIIVAILVIVFRESIADLIRRMLGQKPKTPAQAPMAIAVDEIGEAVVALLAPLNDKVAEQNTRILENNARIETLELADKQRCQENEDMRCEIAEFKERDQAWENVCNRLLSFAEKLIDSRPENTQLLAEVAEINKGRPAKRTPKLKMATA